jgi:hypothetical protein
MAEPTAPTEPAQAAQNTSEERVYTFVLWDHCQWPNPVLRDEFKLRASQPLSDLRKEICERYNYHDEWFNLEKLPHSGMDEKLYGAVASF